MPRAMIELCRDGKMYACDDWCFMAQQIGIPEGIINFLRNGVTKSEFDFITCKFVGEIGSEDCAIANFVRDSAREKDEQANLTDDEGEEEMEM